MGGMRQREEQLEIWQEKEETSNSVWDSFMSFQKEDSQ